MPDVYRELIELARVARPATRKEMDYLEVRRKPGYHYYSAMYPYKAGCWIPVILVVAFDTFTLATIRTDQDWRGAKRG